MGLILKTLDYDSIGEDSDVVVVGGGGGGGGDVIVVVVVVGGDVVGDVDKFMISKKTIYNPQNTKI